MRKKKTMYRASIFPSFATSAHKACSIENEILSESRATKSILATCLIHYRYVDFLLNALIISIGPEGILAPTGYPTS